MLINNRCAVVEEHILCYEVANACNEDSAAVESIVYDFFESCNGIGQWYLFSATVIET